MEDSEGEKLALIDDWHTAFRRGTDFDLWGQPVEAIGSYSRLAEWIRVETIHDALLFTDEQKKVLNKIATCLEIRCKALQSPGKLAGVSLEDLKKVDKCLKHVISTSIKEFPLDISAHIQSPSRTAAHSNINNRIQQISETRLSDDEGDIPEKARGTLLPPSPSVAGQTLLSIRVDKIGLKDAHQYIDPYITVMVKDIHGFNAAPSQDTPVATHKEECCVFFGVDVHVQKPLEQLPGGYAIFFEFKHYKPKKKMVSTKCWALLEKDEIKDGSMVLELYKKPADYKRKKISLLTVKPLFLHIKLTLNS